MVKLTKSQWILGVGLVSTLAAVVWATGSGEDAADAARPVQRAEGARPAAGAAAQARKAAADATANAGVDPGRLIRAADQRRIIDPFAAFSFLPKPPPQPAITVAAVAPPPPAPPAEPPPPVAPNFPWTFIGRLIDDPQHPEVFLAKGDRLTVAHLGDTLDGGWKVLGMDAKSLRVQYVSLKQVVSVNLQAGSDLNSSASAGGSQQNNSNQLVGRFPSKDEMMPQAAPIVDTDTGRSPPPPAPAAAAPVNNGVSGIEVSNMGAPNTP